MKARKPTATMPEVPTRRCSAFSGVRRRTTARRGERGHDDAPPSREARVEQRVGDVDERVDHDERHDEDQADGLHDRRSPFLRRLHEQRPEPVEPERRLDNDAAGDQAGDRQGRPRSAIGTSALRKTCRRTTVPRGRPRLSAVSHVLGAQLLAHRGAGHAGDAAPPTPEGQRDCRQGQVVEAVEEALAAP